jgi:hypothetical protein
MSVVDGSFGSPMKLEEGGVTPLAGGIMQYGYQCGMIWGAAFAAGAQAHRLLGPGPKAEAAAVRAAQRVVASFRALNDTINCLEITDIDRSSSTFEMIKFFLLKGGTIHCFRMATRYAPMARAEIDEALSETDIETPDPPVSCAALVAEKMGMSDMHRTMAAGLAGGIGLSGGACGALGAAIWAVAMKDMRDGTGKRDFKNPKAQKAVEDFLKVSDFEFECSKIAGRSFENAGDHASYIRDGGCSDIIDVLAHR